MTTDRDKPWYENSFGYEYLALYAHRDAAEAHAAVQAIAELVAPPQNQPLLDLCCGAGRHLLSLRQLGFTNLIGLDLSAELLNVAQQSLNRTQVRLVRADMRDIPFANVFGAVLSLFTSFGYFERDEENQAVLAAVWRSLQPGGVFLIDYLNSTSVIDNLVEHDEKTLPDRHICNVRSLSSDRKRVTKTTTVTTTSGQTRTFYESVRLYPEREMIAMLRDEKFVEIASYGSLDGKSFDAANSKRLILRARKPQTARV